MQDNRINVRRAFSSKRIMLLALTLGVGMTLVVGMLFGPTASSTAVQAAPQEGNRGVSAEALSIALNFRDAGSYAAFGGRGLNARGGRMNVRGNAGSAGRVQGLEGLRPDTGNARQAKDDLDTSMSLINQLPCADVAETDLGGKSFGPGVYCLASADLAGAMTLDAGGDENARFVFRVAGSMTTGADASINLVGSAAARNVYFVANDDITIGESSDIYANLVAGDDIIVNSDSTVTGQTLAKGSLTATDANLGGGVGFIEICKDLAAGETTIPAGRIFRFTLTGQINPVAEILVPAGQCSGPIAVTSGNQTVTEVAQANVQVSAIVTTLGNGTAAPTRLISSNLATRTAVVNAPEEGGQENETLVRFTNRTVRSGVIEICKNALDTDVTGPFTFNVQGAASPVTVFTGACSGPINVTIPTQVPAGQFFNIQVTEVGRTNIRFESAFTRPAGRVVGTPTQNPDGGGTVTIQVVADGEVATQTTVFFNNRSVPGQIKVCKITADPTNIPVGTVFRFNVRGITQVGGEPVTEEVVVQAGPLNQGGFCQLTANRFVVGSTVRVDETTNITGLPAGITADMVRVSRIQSFPAGTLGTFEIGNPRVAGTEGTVIARANVTQRNAITTVEFTNFVFRPAILKVCKSVQGTGIPAGTNFTFTLALADPLTSRPLTQTTVTVPAGGCQFVNGPFPAVAAFDPDLGTFNFGTRLIITEAFQAGTTLVAVNSPTAGTGDLQVNLGARQGNLRLNRGLNQFNEIEFVNTAGTGTPLAAGVRLDFDGDRKADLAIFRPSTGTWWYGASSASNQPRATQFGSNGDIVVPADYDADGKTDYAIYRRGEWHIMGSTMGYRGYNFGVATDIPQTGDFDGDRKADLAVYRPSDGTWHVFGSTNGYYAFPFGISTDKPVAADFDGDGSTDAAVYRGGTWYVLGSSSGFRGFSFGMASDTPVVADYDGDRKADAAVYRGGTWYVLGSSAGVLVNSLGTSGDSPTPADYDGDGKADLAVYRSSNNTFYINYSSSSSTGSVNSVPFGTSGDVLMPF